MAELFGRLSTIESQVVTVTETFRNLEHRVGHQLSAKSATNTFSPIPALSPNTGTLEVVRRLSSHTRTRGREGRPGVEMMVNTSHTLMTSARPWEHE